MSAVRDRRYSIVMRRYPRIKSGRLPFLCFALHRMGFFVPRELLRERRALTSPFHPYLRFSQTTGGDFSWSLSGSVPSPAPRPPTLRPSLPRGSPSFTPPIPTT